MQHANCLYYRKSSLEEVANSSCKSRIVAKTASGILPNSYPTIIRFHILLIPIVRSRFLLTHWLHSDTRRAISRGDAALLDTFTLSWGAKEQLETLPNTTHHTRYTLINWVNTQGFIFFDIHREELMTHSAKTIHIIHTRPHLVDEFRPHVPKPESLINAQYSARHSMMVSFDRVVIPCLIKLFLPLSKRLRNHACALSTMENQKKYIYRIWTISPSSWEPVSSLYFPSSFLSHYLLHLHRVPPVAVMQMSHHRPTHSL